MNYHLTLLTSKSIPGTLIFIIGFLFIFPSCDLPQEKDVFKIKSNPGHYVAVGPHFDLSEIKHISDPAVRGINKRYFWRTLEPKKDQYDFTWIQEDLEFCAANNKQLVVFLCDKAFWKKGAMPTYLKQYEVKNEGSFTPIRWHPEFVERFIAIGKAIGDRFDSHPNFEGIAIQESALDISEDILRANNYSPDRYRDALISILNGLQKSLTQSHVFWYQNGMHDNKGHLRQVADNIADAGVFMGGPDVLPYRRWLRQTYKIYDEYKEDLTLFCSVQDDSYRHHKNDIKLSEQEPLHEEGYLTMEEIFLYARDEMHVKYLFWNYFYEEAKDGERTYDDAIEVIRKYPHFNKE